MQRQKLFWNTSLIITLILTTLIYIGCEKKEPPKEETAQNEQVMPKDTLSVAKTDSVPNAKPEIKMPEIKGTWKGSMTKRATVLEISDVSENKFRGSISIAFKDPLNQTISGTFDAETGTFSMQDLKQHRFQGTYKGTFSKDFNEMSGTFTIKADGQKFNFNLVKQ